jgi:hypothetical protein
VPRVDRTKSERVAAPCEGHLTSIPIWQVRRTLFPNDALKSRGKMPSPQDRLLVSDRFHLAYTKPHGMILVAEAYFVREKTTFSILPLKGKTPLDR